MTQSSEERMPQTAAPTSTARIIPFERPQTELQRAVQERAQERIEAAKIKPKVSPLRRIVTFAVALIPVSIIFTGFLLAVHAVRVITSLYAQPTPAQSIPAPEETTAEPSQPGVIILVPDKSVPPESATQPPATVQQPPAREP